MTLKHTLKTINKTIGNSESMISKENYLLHRLDNNVTGLLLYATDINTYKQHLQLFKEKKVTKIYTGIIFGKLNETITKISSKIYYNKNKIKSYINKKGENATTYVYKVKEQSINNNIITEVIFVIITGKTHQIRLHMKSINKPILKDNIYGFNKNKEYLKISSQYNSITLKSLSYIFHFEKYNLGYMII